jgi:thiol-disulfide isomerase/thioredoxin
MKPRWLAVALTVVAAGWGASLWWRVVPPSPAATLPPPPAAAAAADTGALYATHLPDLAGRTQALDQWRDKVLVLNYWATWCTPCREEMPMFSTLAQRYESRGVQFVGIAADDGDPVRDFARTMPVSYPLLVGGQDAILPTRDLGNVPLAVPFTLVLDRAGKVRAAVLGRVQEKALVELLDQL